MVSDFPHTLLLDKVSYVLLFEQEVFLASVLKASSDACILDEMGLSHVPCDFSDSSLEKAHAIMQLERPGVIQDGLNFV